MSTIPIISMHEPWATLFVHGHKRVETRSWRWGAQLPCVLAVHAAKKWTAALYDLSRRDPFYAALRASGVSWPAVGGQRTPTPRGMHFGAVIGLVRVQSVLPTENFFAGTVKPTDEERCVVRIGPEEFAFGDFSERRWGWITDRRLAFAEPIPLRGFQSVWQWAAPPEVLALAEEMQRS